MGPAGIQREGGGRGSGRGAGLEGAAFVEEESGVQAAGSGRVNSARGGLWRA